MNNYPKIKDDSYEINKTFGIVFDVLCGLRDTLVCDGNKYKLHVCGYR